MNIARHRGTVRSSRSRRSVSENQLVSSKYTERNTTGRGATETAFTVRKRGNLNPTLPRIEQVIISIRPRPAAAAAYGYRGRTAKLRHGDINYYYNNIMPVTPRGFLKIPSTTTSRVNVQGDSAITLRWIRYTDTRNSEWNACFESSFFFSEKSKTINWLRVLLTNLRGWF